MRPARPFDHSNLPRLSPEELRHLEMRLRRERARAQATLERLRTAVREQTPSDLPAFRYHIADQGSDSQEQETTLLLASREGRYLYRIEDALRRLYNQPEEFGTCRECGAAIPFERLDALPHVRTCLECKVREESDAEE